MDLKKEQILAKIIAEKLRHFKIYDGANANIEIADPVAILTDITARGQHSENSLTAQFSKFCDEYPGTYTILARCAGRQQSTKFVALLQPEFEMQGNANGNLEIKEIKEQARKELMKELEVQFLKQKIEAMEAAAVEKNSYHATMKAVGMELLSKLFTKGKIVATATMQGADPGGQGIEGLQQYTTMLVQALGRAGYIRAAEVITNDAGTRNMILNFLK